MIQIDMPMPKACYDCLLNYDFCWCNGFYNREEWEKYSDDWNLQVCEAEHRPEYCPLKEQDTIVRCKDCKKRCTALCIQEEVGNTNNQDDWFCADGERKDV